MRAAIWLADDPPRTPLRLLVIAAPGAFHEPKGDADEMLVGELAMNGALALLVDQRTVFPTYNPLVP